MSCSMSIINAILKKQQMESMQISLFLFIFLYEQSFAERQVITRACPTQNIVHNVVFLYNYPYYCGADS